MSEFNFELFVEGIKKFEPKMSIESTWQRLNYCHDHYPDKHTFSNNAIGSYINLGKVAGLYAFFQGKKCIYIGKGKSILSRLENHWEAAHEKNHPTRGYKHRSLFKKYLQSELCVYYVEINEFGNNKTGEAFRATLETILQLKYKPEFETLPNKPRAKKTKSNSL